MALTATLNDVQSQAGVVVPQTSGGGFLSGLARLGSSAASAIGNLDSKAQQKETQAALNDAAQSVQDRFRVAQAALNGAPEPQSIETGVPKDVAAAADKMSKVQQAVNNGYLPETAMSLRFESTIDELFRLHPERKAAIAQYFQSQGLDHYVFRDVKNEMASRQNAEATQQAAENFAYEAGVKAGLFNPQTTSRADGIILGQEWLQKKAMYDLATTQLNNAKTRAELSDLERKRGLETGSRNLVQAMIGDADIRVNQLVQSLSAMTIEANEDPTGQKHTLLKEAIPQIAQGIETARLNAIAQVYQAGGGKDEADAVSQYYDQMRESIVRNHTGDLSRDNLNKKILEGMQTQFGIDAARAFPLWNQLAKLPGMSNALPLLFGGDPAHQLSKEQQDAIKKELSGWTPGSTQGLYQIQRIADVLRGDLKLSQLNVEQARNIIGGVNTAVVGNGAAVIAGDKNPETTKPFLNGLEQLSDATFTLTPGVEPKSQWKAAQMLGDQTTMNALVALAKDANTSVEAQQVVVSTRAAAQKGLIVAKTGEWSKGNPGSMMKLVWDDKAQIVKQVVDENAYKAYVDNQNALRSGHGTPRSARQMETSDASYTQKIVSREELMKKGDPILAQRAQTINKYLDVMTRLSPVDPTVPKGITPAQVRKAAFLGEPLDQAAAKGPNVDPFEQRLKQLEQQAIGVNTQSIQNSTDDRNRARYEPIAWKAADQYGVPREVASFLFGQESGWNAAVGQTRIDNNGDGKPDSTAVGIAQFTEGTGARYGLVDKANNVDLRSDATKAIPAAMKYLSDLYKQYGDWEKALRAYGVIHPSNFKTQESYNDVLNRARAAIQGG